MDDYLRDRFDDETSFAIGSDDEVRAERVSIAA